MSKAKTQRDTVGIVLSFLLAVSISTKAEADTDLVDLLPSLIPGTIFATNGTSETTRPDADNPGETVVDRGFAYGTFTPSGDLSALSGQAFQEFQNLPVGSAVAAFTYYFDPELNVFKPSEQGLGPIFADRAQTMGKGKFNIGVSWSHIDFDEIEGTNLNHIPIETSPENVYVDAYSDKTQGTAANQASQRTDNVNGTSSTGVPYPEGGLSFTCNGGSGLSPGGFDPPISGTVTNVDLTEFFVACTGPDGDYLTQIVGGSDIEANVHLEVELFNIYMAFGVLDNFDIGIILPILEIDLDTRVTYSGVDPEALFALFPAFPPDAPPQDRNPGDMPCGPADFQCFRNQIDAGLVLRYNGTPLGGDSQGNQREFIDAITIVNDVETDGTSRGIGDLMIRGKYRFLETDYIDMAARLDIAFPTGSEDNFRSTGEYMFGFNLIMSKAFDWFSPHANFAIQARTGGKENQQFRWTVGADARLHERVAVAVDFVGNEDLYHDGVGDTQMAIAPGLKVNPWRNLVLSGAAVVRLNHQGLRADIIPSLTVEYTFF